jgi:hypothetical protein
MDRLLPPVDRATRQPKARHITAWQSEFCVRMMIVATRME